jgi:asparagine N-glycosylation enzyme membrane subunit Stt3
MINSAPPSAPDDRAPHSVGSGPIGAAVLAGIATAIVLAIWIGFYFFVFVPRTVP